VPQVKSKNRVVVRMAAEKNDGTTEMTAEERRAMREAKAKEREERIRKKRSERQAMLAEIEAGKKAAPTAKDMQQGVQGNMSGSGDVAEEKTTEALESEDGTYGANAKGLFGWVNNNPSSKNAVYIGSFRGEGGNVGEMMKAIRGRGRTEEGVDVSVPQPNSKPPIRTYVRSVPASAAPSDGESAGKNKSSPIVFVHGVLASSWTFRDVLGPLATAGHDCYAFDWPGCGYSEWPQPGVGFSFTEERMVAHLENLLVSLKLAGTKDESGMLDSSEVSGKITLVVQGFVQPQYVLKWALKQKQLVDAVIVLNTPLASGGEHKLPFVLQQYKLPLVNSFVAQDAMRSERFLEGGGPYVMTLGDAERFREPFLESMMPGLAVTDTLVQCKYDQLLTEIEKTLGTENRSELPAVRVVWGVGDKYLSSAAAKKWCEKFDVPFTEIEGAGFVVQSDWPEKVVDAMKAILL